MGFGGEVRGVGEEVWDMDGEVWAGEVWNVGSEM